MSKTAPIIVGALGGITPNLVTLAGQLTAKNAELPNATYLIGLLIFAGLGAAVAYIWQERNLKKAFYIGIGLPSLIQLNIANLGTTHQPHPVAISSITLYTNLAIVRVASAQESAKTTETYSLNRKLVLPIPPLFSITKSQGIGISINLSSSPLSLINELSSWYLTLQSAQWLEPASPMEEGSAGLLNPI